MYGGDEFGTFSSCLQCGSITVPPPAVTEGKQMTETKFVVHDLAQLMRAVADLIDPVNESAERLREEMAEKMEALDKLLEEQSAGIAKEYELD